MMELVIRIKNGQPDGHPISKQNFLQVWPNLDFYNPGLEFVKFNRIQRPNISIYQVLENCEYRWNGNEIEDYWIVREMTEEEKELKQNEIKELWKINGFKSWIFNKQICEFEAPIPHPNDGKKYIWNEETINWQEVISEDN